MNKWDLNVAMATVAQMQQLVSPWNSDAFMLLSCYFVALNLGRMYDMTTNIMINFREEKESVKTALRRCLLTSSKETQMGPRPPPLVYSPQKKSWAAIWAKLTTHGGKKADPLSSRYFWRENKVKDKMRLSDKKSAAAVPTSSERHSYTPTAWEEVPLLLQVSLELLCCAHRWCRCSRWRPLRITADISHKFINPHPPISLLLFFFAHSVACRQ